MNERPSNISASAGARCEPTALMRSPSIKTSPGRKSVDPGSIVITVAFWISSFRTVVGPMSELHVATEPSYGNPEIARKISLRIEKTIGKMSSSDSLITKNLRMIPGFFLQFLLARKSSRGLRESCCVGGSLSMFIVDMVNRLEKLGAVRRPVRFALASAQ